MGATGDDSLKKRKKSSRVRLADSSIPMRGDNTLNETKKKSKQMRKRDPDTGSSQGAEQEVNFHGADGKVKKKHNKKKKSLVDAAKKVNDKTTKLMDIKEDEVYEISNGGKTNKKLKIKKKKMVQTSAAAEDVNLPHANEDGDEIPDKEDVESKPTEHKLQKSRKKKKNNVVGANDEVNAKDDGPGRQDDNFPENRREDSEADVYMMSSGDEDYSRGMQKWITQYHQGRPGLKVLQERIDEFIMDHEAEEEKARAEREAQAAEGGWTVVVHHKGRKKTTESETGVAVGSVAQAAVLDKMAKKKKKDVGLDFYGFQKKEAKINEVMMLQSKFEQDKKRIQQMRAARKFRPY